MSRKPKPAEAAALRRAAGSPWGYVDGPSNLRNRIIEAGWSDPRTGHINEAGRKVAADNPARVTSKGLAALRAAADDPKGWFPVDTAPRVIGDLLRDGFARRAPATEIPEIGPLGREFLEREPNLAR